MSFLVAVLAASLLGSVHCAAMCGGFVCMYAGLGPTHVPASASRGRQSVLASHGAYNLGRLASYLVLGALAGSLGHGVDRLGSVVGVGRLATIVAGALMVAWGGSTLLLALGVRVPSVAPLRAAQAALTSLLVRVRGKSPTVRGAATGLLTTLLPCGWMYAFVATAGGTGRVRDALAVMLFFWVGTLPMMLAVGFGAQRVFGSFRRRLPLVSAGVVVVLGVLSIAGRTNMRPIARSAHSAHSVETAHDGR